MELHKAMNQYEKDVYRYESLLKQSKEKMYQTIIDNGHLIDHAFIDFYYFETEYNTEVLKGILGTNKNIKSLVSKNYYITKLCDGCGQYRPIHVAGRSDVKKGRHSYDLCDECKAERDKQSEASQRRYAAERVLHEKVLNRLKSMPYKEYLKTDHWKGTRKWALKRAGYKCALCDSSKNLNVHHRTYDNRGHELANDVIVLCQCCHAKFHDKEE